MKRNIKDKAKGTFHEVNGSLKEKTGQAIANPRLATEGRVDRIRGRFQKKLAEAKTILGA